KARSAAAAAVAAASITAAGTDAAAASKSQEMILLNPLQPLPTTAATETAGNTTEAASSKSANSSTHKSTQAERTSPTSAAVPQYRFLDEFVQAKQDQQQKQHARASHIRRSSGDFDTAHANQLNRQFT